MVPSPESFFLRSLDRLFTWPNHLSLAFLHLSGMFSTACVAACPSAHLHFCHFQFLRVGASGWHCLHHVQHSRLNDHLVDFSFNICGGTLLSHWTLDIFLHLFHPTHVTIALRGASQISSMTPLVSHAPIQFFPRDSVVSFFPDQ